MQRQKYCVYNESRESFLSLGVEAADTTLARLKGLLGKLKLGLDEGLWIVPSQGIHTVGVLFHIRPNPVFGCTRASDRRGYAWSP